ncbi:ATP-binding cassette domain-containing protein [Ensifer soli]|uniref:ATP-binding cassette domain-containing protein n=1 Tax=Ciceribacter sp. sgz301302 TaxID=3342379 RepID=UPI0035B7131D
MPSDTTSSRPLRPEDAFRVEAVGLAVDGRAILSDVTLNFPAGEITALVGHNGSGKSTLLKMLARQQQPDTGRVTFCGTPVSTFEPRAFSRRVAYLAQDVGAAAGMTVRELVACGRYPWHGALGRFTARDREKVEEAIALTRLEGLAGRFVETLSGGERQRAWIAMLVAQDSDCLLLDEPTSALDIAHQMEVLALIRRLSHEKGLGVVVVLHDINMSARFADRIHALKRGRVVASGRPADIMRRAALQEIYGIAMDVIPHPGLGLPLAYVS